MARRGNADVQASNVEELAKRVRDAATQRLHLLAREADGALQAKGCTVLYSIDTDIVHLHMDPTGEEVGSAASSEPDAQEDVEQRHYAHIFEGDSQDLSIALGTRITEFIFFALANDAPVFVLPPVQREIARVFVGVAARAGSEHESVQQELAALSDSLTELAEGIAGAQDPGERLDLLLSKMPMLRNFLFGFRGPSAQLSRLADLMDRSPMVDLDDLLRKSASLNEAERAALSRPTTTIEFIRFSTIKAAWQDRLREMKSPLTPAVNIEADAEVLAKLEVVNRALPDSLRVMHVTGDPAVFRAADLYQDGNEAESFARRYLRDPRAFLAEPDVLATNAAEQSLRPKDLGAWLDVFLGTFTGGPDGLASLLRPLSYGRDAPDRQLVREVLARKPNALSDFDSRWAAFCQTRALDLAEASRAHTSTPIEQYREALEAYGWTDLRPSDAQDVFAALEGVIGNLKKEVDSRVKATWNGCFDVAREVGLTLAQSHDGTERSRYAPPLLFAGFDSAAAFFNSMIRDVPRKDYQEVVGSFKGENDYVKSLVFAGLFGAQGKWYPARLLAERAISFLGERSFRPVPEGRISGREAHYLRAICCRLTARNSEDLDEAESSLKDARAALDIDKETKRDHPVTDLRFKAEDIALRVSRCLFRRFMEEGEDWSGLLGDWRRDINELLGLVPRELADEHLQARVRVGLEVNYLMALIVSDVLPPGLMVRNTEGFADHERILRGLQNTTKRLGSVGGGPYLVRSVLLAARAALDPPRATRLRERRIKEVEKHFEKSQIEKHRTTVYDRKRFDFLHRFAISHLVRRAARR